MHRLPLPSSSCPWPWPDKRGLAKAEGLKAARLELLMEDLLTGGRGGGDGVLTTGTCELAADRMDELTTAQFSGEGV